MLKSFRPRQSISRLKGAAGAALHSSEVRYMTSKYWRLKLKGSQPIDKVAGAVSPEGAILLRVHVEKDETIVYFAAEQTVMPELTKAMTLAEKPEEVSMKEILTIG